MDTQILKNDNTSFKPGSAQTVYILYLLGLVIGITGIVGLVMAYMERNDDMPDWYRSHIQFQIRTFWYGAVWLLAGTLLSLVFLGYFVLLFWLVWLIIRCVKGMKLLAKNQAIPEPTSFFGFGG